VERLAYDATLGKDWFNDFEPNIGWSINKVTVGPHSWFGHPSKSLPEILSIKQFNKLSRRNDPETFIGVLMPSQPSSTSEDTPIKKTPTDSNKLDQAARANLPPEVRSIVDKYPKVFAPFEG
jgi:hypothetical protein